MSPVASIALKLAPYAAIGALFFMWRGAEDEATTERQLRVSQIAAANVEHEVTKASLREVRSLLAIRNFEVTRRAEEYAESLRVLAAMSQRNESIFATSQQTISSLLAGRGGPRDPDCRTPADVRAALQ